MPLGHNLSDKLENGPLTLVHAQINLRIHADWSTLLLFSLGRTIAKLATCQISKFKLVSVAGQSGLSITWSQTSRTGFSLDVA